MPFDGVWCRDPLDAVLVVLEHEVCHVYEVMRYGTQSHGAMFCHLGTWLFGHALGKDQYQVPGMRVAKAGIAPGTKVRFHWQGSERQGVIREVGALLTVAVETSRRRQGPVMTLPYSCVEADDVPFVQPDASTLGVAASPRAS
ncbi:MAG: hypothetical protein K8T90_05375 [Planctomycetes bacterium]|nr:hypothetical protein [Planctomycetota bacterium]